MTYELYDYLDARGQNVFKEWWGDLQKPERGKLRGKLDMLQRYGEDLFPEILTGTHVAGILKLRVHGPVQLRPMLCRGPESALTEYTLLQGATERDDQYVPADSPEAANDKKSVVARDLTRRTAHVRVTK